MCLYTALAERKHVRKLLRFSQIPHSAHSYVFEMCVPNNNKLGTYIFFITKFSKAEFCYDLGI